MYFIHRILLLVVAVASLARGADEGVSGSADGDSGSSRGIPIVLTPWKKGRSTYFGNDGYSIHEGSCGLGYQFPDVYPGYDVIAISDLSAEFSKSCGACYEVRCREEAYTDGKGNSYDGQVCHNTTESLVVRVVDACPCNYPNNAYSNQRWCCQDQGAGDMHVDMSIWAFEKLASKNKGSMALSFRQVPCNYMPPFPAYAREAETPKDQPPSSARKPHELVFIKREDDKGVLQGAVNRVGQDENTWGEIIPGDKVYRDGTFEGSWRGKDGIDFIDGAVQEKVTALAALINSTNARFIEFAGQVTDLALGGFGFDGKDGKSE